nr:hypothetical protein [Tanacetum cinerariifolium]
MTEEWSFLKLILAKSPMLKKVRISYHQLYVDEHHKIMKKLSGFRHASKDVDFILTPMEDDFCQQEYTEMDRISNLPPGILESILCFLPLEEAVSTSILSKDWRYRWIKIPKLVFQDFKFRIPTNKAESSDGSESSDGAESSDGEQMLGQPSKKKNNLTELTILQVLLMHEGPLYEFALSMNPK